MKKRMRFENYLKGRHLTISWILVVFCVVFFTTATFGKIKLPARININVEGVALPKKPIKIRIIASCKIPFKNGIIELYIPEISGKSAGKVVLWEGNADAVMEKQFSYSLGVVPEGKHKVITSFKFTPQRTGAREVGVAKYLYLDSRSAEILSSNVSFGHIKRSELKQEMEKRGLLGLSMEEIKKKNPEIARRILDVNRVKGVETGLPKKEDVKKSSSTQADKEKPGKREKIEGKIKEVPSDKKESGIKLQREKPKKKTILSLPKAPMQGTKKAIKIILSEEEKERLEVLTEKAKYKNSDQAKEKRKAIEKKKEEKEKK
ncbi:MAG: hypothetical protein KAW12_05835 [Candidatus Aminicenantes bacterium]|nr:hypothetical protein [Candidatus Aminicenantes bacterium]